jgi:hypothetical protein
VLLATDLVIDLSGRLPAPAELFLVS